MGLPYAEVIGDPVDHSKSPLIHRFWLEKLGIEGKYGKVRVQADRLHEYLFSCRDDGAWRGCNVTMPLKKAVVPFLSRLTRTAEKCGAANTVVPIGDRRLEGHNTDATAVVALLAGVDKPDYQNHVATYVQIIGAGGAAWAAMVGATGAGYVDFEFYNRTLAGAQTLAVLFDLDPRAYAGPLEALGPIRNPDDGPEDQRYSHVIVNATPLGMPGKPELDVDLTRYYPDTIVIDMPYAKGGTRFAREARALGLRTFDGFDVLIAQADLAFELFFGAPAPRQHDDELRELLTR